MPPGVRISAIEVQPSPMTLKPSKPSSSASCPGSASCAAPCSSLPVSSSSASVTLAPLGGVKANVDAAGLEKSTLVNPASTTALPPLAADRVNFSGTPVSASTAMRTEPMVEPDCFGLISSWYASRPATRAVPSTVTEVVSPAAASACSAKSFGVAEAPLRSFGAFSASSPASRPSGASAW